MTKAYRMEAREHLKNCVDARFSAEALVIALVGGRIGQSDWSIECDRIISLLDDDDDYRRGFKDGLKANTKAAFSAAKQAISERTCEVLGEEYDDLLDYWETELSCGHVYNGMAEYVSYCPKCGAKVIEE